ncbi:hypothetical protein NQ318_005321 [Aromia moschata]|uniref:DNA polymerase alpha subunit B n=1 Tax=Aromia moschata TaxID=1265417 RepID=A0AAV8XX36_9CUCU|nr:hypothetical protein NQ318_005321 [Aromia moschata]
MASKEEIAAYFAELNIEASDVVLDKCKLSNLKKNIKAIFHNNYLHRDADTTVSSYTATTPKSNKTQKQQTPAHQRISKGTVLSDTYDDFRSSVGSPSTSEKYSQRTDSRSVQCSYGSPLAQFRRGKDYPVSVKNVNKGSLQTETYMYEIMGKKAKSLNSMSQWLGHAILEKHGLSLTEGTLKSHVYCLRVRFETNLGRAVTLNINKLSNYSLFPGQVAVVQGNNPNSTAFIAEKILTDTLLPLPTEPPIIDDELQIVVACGPYTLENNLSYEPLQDLIKYVTEYKPHVLLLVGPFIERSHMSIHDGSLMQTFDSFFESLIENIMNALQGIDIQVVVASSQKDAHHHPVYPTRPYNIRENYTNLTFVSDPCQIDVNGVVIGATSIDVLFHIGQFEMCHPSGMPDRMGRIASPSFKPAQFLSLISTPQGCVYRSRQYGILENKPHILVLPSTWRHFVKSVQDCLVINPERLAKGPVAGTFARIEISPGTGSSLCNHVSCQVIKV